MSPDPVPDALLKYPEFMQMPIVTAQYWTMVHGTTPDEVKKDLEGMQAMRTLGKNMAWLLKCIDSGKKNGITFRKQDGDEFTLPPDLKNVKKAPAGEYKLHSTGEVVVNPDLLSTWNLYAPE